METVPWQRIWEIVKKNSSFLVKEFGNGTQSVQFSKEPNNLYNVNSYKHSGNLSDFEFVYEVTLELSWF
ncbi:putative ribosomal protein L28e [Helianthus annuus]|nr:putative ribosomal protein L28e [Helianthus annuus]KAJ0746766.1 putative ribosomal protein L28e [Helianthus annuus]